MLKYTLVNYKESGDKLLNGLLIPGFKKNLKGGSLSKAEGINE
jgi:hypothetical protein